MSVSEKSSSIPQWKIDTVNEINTLIDKYSSFGVIGFFGIPSNQLQQIRKNLREIGVLKICRNTLMFRAFDKGSEKLKEMKEYVDKQTGLLFTNENPFKLYKTLEKGKTPAPIKPGMVAPKDIVVEKGPTSFPPGPIVGELQSVGIPAAIESGKVVIRQTKTVVKEGEKVDSKLASILTRLEIYPVELGLELRAVYENGTIYDSKVLRIDETEYIENISSAIRQAFNLSINSAYPTSLTIGSLIAKASSESRNLAINSGIAIPEVINELILKANSQMLSLASVLLEKDENAICDKLKEKLQSQKVEKLEVKEEKKAEEQKKEEKKEEPEEDKEEDIAAGLGALFG